MASELEFANDVIDRFFDIPQADDIQDLEEAEGELTHEAENEELHEARSALSGNIEEEEPPAVVTPLTNARTHALSTLHIYFDDHLLEYPKTHPQGVTLVLNTRGLERAQIEKSIKDFQYSRRQVHPPKKIYCSYLQAHVIKQKYQCTGVRVCEYLDPRLLAMHHETVGQQSYETMQEIVNSLHITEKDPKKRGANSFHQSVLQRFRVPEGACTNQSEDCEPFMGYYPHENVAGVRHPFIGCTQSTPETQRHHFHKPLAGLSSQIDFHFLEALFRDEGPEIGNETCKVVDHTATRKKLCGIDHMQGQGKLVSIGCDVEFHILIPENTNTTPYVLFTSHGTHTHPVPPPNKPPQSMIADVLRIIRDLQDPELTLSSFLKSPQLKDFCEDFGGHTLSQIHKSFVNMDRFSALIRKEKALLYPEGREFNGLMFELHRNPGLREYVQKTYNDANGIMVFCALKEQLVMLNSLESFEVDMCYKRIRSKDFTEVTFATFLPDHGKIFTLLRVYTNQETSEGYRLLFERAFKIVSDITECPVTFHYLHGDGIKALVLDMCPKQMSGLGHYLKTIDPEHRPWTWQLRNIFVICRVHFQRSVDRAVKVSPGISRFLSLHSVLMGLLDCNSEQEYFELIDCLQGHDDETIRNWATHKNHPVIRAGLNKYCSLIPTEFFDSVRNITNAVEQTHFKSYATGKFTTLLGAIFNSRRIDQRDIDQYDARGKFNIRHSYRDDTLRGRYERHLRREVNLKKRKVNHEAADLAELAPEDAILFAANSSGEVRSGSRRGRGRLRAGGLPSRPSSPSSATLPAPGTSQLGTHSPTTVTTLLIPGTSDRQQPGTHSPNSPSTSEVLPRLHSPLVGESAVSSRSQSPIPRESRSQSRKSGSRANSSELQRAASVNLQLQNLDIRRQQMEIERLETESRVRSAEARQLELANEEKDLQLQLLRRQLESEK